MVCCERRGCESHHRLTSLGIHLFGFQEGGLRRNTNIALLLESSWQWDGQICILTFFLGGYVFFDWTYGENHVLKEPPVLGFTAGTTHGRRAPCVANCASDVWSRGGAAHCQWLDRSGQLRQLRPFLTQKPKESGKNRCFQWSLHVYSFRMFWP